MRDQLNGQLYDGWRTDCDAAYDEDYTHNIIPADEDAVYENYEDKLAE